MRQRMLVLQKLQCGSLGACSTPSPLFLCGLSSFREQNSLESARPGSVYTVNRTSTSVHLSEGATIDQILFDQYLAQSNQRWTVKSKAIIATPSNKKKMEYGAGGYFNLPLTDHMITCLNNSPSDFAEVNRTEVMRRLKYYSYGITLPAICFLGIVGNILNLVVLTRPTMRGPAYVYMRGIIILILLLLIFNLIENIQEILCLDVEFWKLHATCFNAISIQLRKSS